MTWAATSKDFYVDRLMREWRLDEQSEVFQARVRRVLLELAVESQLVLSGEPTFEVRISVEDGGPNVWAFFPFHRGSYDVSRFSGGFIPPLKPSPATRILLVFNGEAFEKQPARQTEDDLRHHLGHTLLFLRSPKASNECSDARREWRASVHEPDLLAKKTAEFPHGDPLDPPKKAPARKKGKNGR
jgi:hypothetical protein